MIHRFRITNTERFQIIWSWRRFLWPFYLCDCEAHDRDPHVVYDGWQPLFFHRITSDWGLSVVYRWIFRIGPLEVRRWLDEEEKAPALKRHIEASQ